MATVGNTGIHRSGSISDYLNNSYDSPDCMGLHWEYRLTNDFVLDDIMDLPSGAVDMYKLPTIQGDVERISNRSRSISFSWCDISDDIDSKTEIRNGDCMWSSFGAGTCSSNSNTNSNSSNHNSNSSNGGSNSAASSYSESSAVPPAIVTGGALLIKREPEEEHEDAHETEDEEENRTTAAATTATGTLTVAEHISKLRSKTGTTATIAIPRPKASNGNILRYPSVKLSSNSNTAEQHIPPGASLLRKSNTKLQQMRYLSNLSSSVTLPLKTNNNNNNNNDEHLPEFRHNVDLAACVMGSNNISLTQDSNSSNSCKSNNDANNIDHLSRELQNKSKEFRIDKLPYRVPSVTPENIADVLDVISQQCDAAVSAAATLSPPASSSDGDSDDGECSVVDSSCGSATSLDGNCMQHISDHSYTRCNEMETNLETPSDSDEEIDVVSLNDKKLPNNPSDRDRRFFSKVINKNLGVPSNGRSNYSLPYTPASSSPVKSEANSRYPSPSPSPFPPSYQPVWNSIWLPTRSESSSAGSDCTTQPTAGQANSRKRLYKNKDAGYRVYPVKGFAAKKRVKKSVNETTTTTTATTTTGNVLQQQHQPTLGASGSSSSASTTSSSSVSGGSSSSSSSNSNSNSNSMLKRQFSLDEADTIEKRNQHNDMERQRRIGLKNLFEALKKQIPTIRDKERAPKVNILREAAKLCEQLSSEERELSLKRQQLKAKLKQQQDLLARLRSAKNLGE